MLTKQLNNNFSTNLPLNFPSFSISIIYSYIVLGRWLKVFIWYLSKGILKILITNFLNSKHNIVLLWCVKVEFTENPVFRTPDFLPKYPRSILFIIKINILLARNKHPRFKILSNWNFNTINYITPRYF